MRPSHAFPLPYRWLCLWLVSLFAVGNVAAQSTGTYSIPVTQIISGQVINSTGQPVKFDWLWETSINKWKVTCVSGPSTGWNGQVQLWYALNGVKTAQITSYGQVFYSNAAPNAAITFGLYMLAQFGGQAVSGCTYSLPAGAVQNLTITPDNTVSGVGGSVSFAASGGQNAYVWSTTGGGVITGTGATVSVSFPSAGSFTVNVYNEGGNGVAQSPVATATVVVALKRLNLVVKNLDGRKWVVKDHELLSNLASLSPGAQYSGTMLESDLPKIIDLFTEVSEIEAHGAGKTMFDPTTGKYRDSTDVKYISFGFGFKLEKSDAENPMNKVTVTIPNGTAQTVNHDKLGPIFDWTQGDTQQTPLPVPPVKTLTPSTPQKPIAPAPPATPPTPQAPAPQAPLYPPPTNPILAPGASPVVTKTTTSSVTVNGVITKQTTTTATDAEGNTSTTTEGSGDGADGSAGQEPGASAANALPSVGHAGGYSVAGSAPDFTVALPGAFGGLSFDLNPFRTDRLGGVIDWFRTAVGWLCVVLFGFWASKEVADWTKATSTIRQASGNAVVAGSGAQATALVAAAAITVAVGVFLVAIIGWLGSGVITLSGVLSTVGQNPTSGLIGGAAWMLDRVFPVSTILSCVVARLAFNFAAAKFFAVCMTVIRYIVP